MGKKACEAKCTAFVKIQNQNGVVYCPIERFNENRSSVLGTNNIGLLYVWFSC